MTGELIESDQMVRALYLKEVESFEWEFCTRMHREIEKGNLTVQQVTEGIEALPYDTDSLEAAWAEYVEDFDEDDFKVTEGEEG